MEVPYAPVTDPPVGVEMHSALDDPYLAARDEVRDALQKLQRTHEEWKRLLRTEDTAESERFQHLHAEILGEVQGIGEDLEGIALAIKTVEDNRSSFPLDDAEMSRRRDFLRTCQATLQDIKAHVSNPQTNAKIDAYKREAQAAKASTQAAPAIHCPSDPPSSGLSDDFLSNEDFLRSQGFKQQSLRAEQEDFMVDIGKAATRMKEVALTVNTELSYQQRLLEDVDADIERETENLQGVMKHVGKLLQTNDRSQLYVIIALSVLFLVLLFFVVA
jgi:regulator of vacuolar morphogenesis